MVNSQEWLDKNYPKLKKPEEIITKNSDLEGDLTIEEYKEVWNINLSGNRKLSGVELKNLPNLTHFYVNDCQIKDIKINNCPNISDLDVGGNLLETTDFLDGLNSERLRRLSIYDNNFRERGLDFLGKFVNLRGLYIDNRDKKRFDRGTYNRWRGSLEPLQGLKKLKWLGIGNTNIDSGLEYLPESVKKIGCNNEWEEMGCSKIKNELEEASQITGVTEKLQGVEEEEEHFAKNYYRTAPWKQANGSLPSDGEMEVENKKKEKDKLWKKIFNKAEERKILPADSQEYKDLSKEIEELGRIMGEKSKEIEKWDRWKEKVRKRNNIKRQNLRDLIENEKQRLEKEKNDLISYPWEKEIKSLLETQVEITRFDSIRASEKKRILLKKMVGIEEDLNKICERQSKITEWQIRLEEIEKISVDKKENNVKKAPLMPSRWRDVLNKENKLEENYKFERVNYKEMHAEKPSTWEIKRSKRLSLEELPLRLYDTTGKIDEKNIDKVKDYVKKKEECYDIKSYAMLSYMWGNKKPGNVLSEGGVKSLLKSIEACRYLGIKYLWIDQLCVNQEDEEEKAGEVKRMRKYYSGSDVTLVSINSNFCEENPKKSPPLVDVLKKIIRSDWFSRSWTFQEGWLSKQTVFMFDDGLVDGRALASLWALHQPSYTGYGKYNNFNEFYEGTMKIATPLGWVYYKKGYNAEDKVELRLHEALREIKDRKRSIPVDGIYSIIGLLSYVDSELIEVSYQESMTPEKALISVMKAAVKACCGEPLAWHGEGSGWLPEIYKENSEKSGKFNYKGSTSVVGGIEVNYRKKSDCESSMVFKGEDIEINASRYTIKSFYSETTAIEESEGFIIENGAHIKKVTVEVNDQREEITLLGTSETISKIDINDVLLVISEKEWESSKPLAVLASRRGDIYHRKGLVEFLTESDAEKLKKGAKEIKIIIGMKSTQESQVESGLEKVSQLEKSQANVQASPKGKF
jgi:Leucine-rich repeat (LRR) protein